MITKDYNFVNDTLQVFEGFYDSALYNSDMLYNHNYVREEGESEKDIDFPTFTKEVCEGVADLLRDLVVCEDNFITKCEYKGISSPKYYNFTTDRLVLNLDVDLDALKEWALSAEVRGEFNEYLQAKYTSYDGYCSFVENNVEDYFEKSFEDYSNVLVEFYMLTKIYDTIKVVESVTKRVETSYWWDMVELARDCFYDNLVDVESEDED